MDNDILIKTSLLGFNKKDVMDYIEKLQKENKELRARLEEIGEYGDDSVSSFVTYEDLSVGPEDEEMLYADVEPEPNSYDDSVEPNINDYVPDDEAADPDLYLEPQKPVKRVKIKAKIKR